jgi:hypothetical protein
VQVIHLLTLDQYCNNNNINKVDVIKVDIEGGEFAFLKGAENIIRDNHKLILVVEMMEENFVAAGYSVKDIFSYLMSKGFKAYLPKSFPFGLKEITSISADYSDNVIFLRGY